MISLNANPAQSLKELLVSAGVTIPIYVNGGTPSNNLPESFIEIVQNGAITSQASQMGFGQCFLLVTINVKLLSNDSTNDKRENLILGTFQSLFSAAVTKSGFTYSLDKGRMVFQGKSITSGYSTKMLNILTKIK